MNNSKRQFLKLIAGGTVLIPVATHLRFTPLKEDVALHLEEEQPQLQPQAAEVGGGMTGVDLSRFYKPTKISDFSGSV